MSNYQQPKVEKDTQVREWMELVNALGGVALYYMDNVGTPDELNNSSINLVDSFNVSLEESKKNIDTIGINQHGHINRKTRYSVDSVVSRLNALVWLLEKLYGELDDLNTFDRTSFVNTLNELKRLIGSTSGIKDNLINDVVSLSQKYYKNNNYYALNVNRDDKTSGVRAINGILDTIGGRNLSELTSKDKRNLIDAINSVVTDFAVIDALNTTLTTEIGNVKKLKDVPNVVGSLNAAYNKMGTLEALYQSTVDTKVLGVEAINKFIDDIGIIPDDLETVAKKDCVSALNETHSWIDKGKWIYARTNRQLAIGQTSVVGAKLGISGNVLADEYKGKLEGNVTGKIIGDVTGAVSGTSMSWKHNIKLTMRGAISGYFSFGGEHFKNIDWKKYVIEYPYYVKVGRWKDVKKIIRGGYNKKKPVVKKIPKKVSYTVMEKSGYWKEQPKTIKRGHWQITSERIPPKTTNIVKPLDSTYVAGCSGVMKLYESDAKGTKGKFLGTAYKSGVNIKSDSHYILGEVEKYSRKHQRTINITKFDEAKRYIFKNTTGELYDDRYKKKLVLSDRTKKSRFDNRWGLGLIPRSSSTTTRLVSGDSTKEQTFQISIPLADNPNLVVADVNFHMWTRRSGAYAIYAVDVNNVKHPLEYRGNNRTSRWLPNGMQDDFSLPRNSSYTLINKRVQAKVPNGAKKIVFEWHWDLYYGSNESQDMLRINNIRVVGTFDSGPVSAFLQTSNGIRIQELKHVKNDLTKFIRRLLPSWRRTHHWVSTNSDKPTSFLWKTSKNFRVTEKAKFKKSKKWIDTSYVKTERVWVDTSKPVTRTKTIYENKTEFVNEWIPVDRIENKKVWVDESRWVTRTRLDTDKLSKLGIVDNSSYILNVVNSSIRNRASLGHTHDGRYLKLGNSTDMTLYKASACYGANSVWSLGNATYNFANYNKGSIFVGQNSCGGTYVWVKYLGGTTISSWQRLK